MEGSKATQDPYDEILTRLDTQVTGFPRLPGVYLMKNQEGTVIYVGKAKDLRARVKSYFLGGDGRPQIQFLLKRVTTIEKIVTASEQQALVLERDLIAKYKPRYNIRLKDDKEFLSIRLDENAEWPRLELVRKREDDGARYYGPYSFSYELRSMLEIIKRVIPLRTCTDTVFYNRQRPCLEYQIRRCAGPCCLPVDKGEYRKCVRQAQAILEGRTDKLLNEFNAQMEKASTDLRFEEAAVLRDRITILKNFKAGTSLVSSRGEDRDVFALFREERLVALSVVNVRNGRVANTSNFSLSGVEIPDEEVIEEALQQFYERGREIPEEIVLPFELPNQSMLNEAVAQKRGGAVEFIVPSRGVKARLLDLAQLNAREHFSASFDAESRYKELARKLSLKLKLRQIPRRIECVDISNLQGSDIVGALVSFYDGVPDKTAYRTYKISQQGKPDDFAAVNEVVGRRLERGTQEDNLPDLLLIDGGPGQLAMALEARDALEVPLEIISIAKMRTESDVQSSDIRKKPERIYVEGGDDPIELDAADEVTHFLQRMRDEVHRYVIGFHRRRRAGRVFQSILDSIPGVGAQRRGRLLRQYGSVDRMAEAPVEELAKVGRMPKSLAERVLERVRGAKRNDT
jgi:excinuclease ABC subunit C